MLPRRRQTDGARSRCERGHLAQRHATRGIEEARPCLQDDDQDARLAQDGPLQQPRETLVARELLQQVRVGDAGHLVRLRRLVAVAAHLRVHRLASGLSRLVEAAEAAEDLHSSETQVLRQSLLQPLLSAVRPQEELTDG